MSAMIVALLKAALKHLGVLAVQRGVQRLVGGQPIAPESKGLLESTTVQGVAVTAFSGAIGYALAGVVAIALQRLGYEVDLATAQYVATQLTTAVGALWAIRGRLKATKRIA
jgi:hypothetical protein